MTCRCGESSRAKTKHFFRRTVAGTTFTADADVDGCAGCGEVYIPASLMIAFERSIAAELARRGPVSDETFRWIRKAAGVERGELAQILGVTPETIAGWEAERRPIDRAAWLLVAAMVLDSVEGPRPIRSRLKSQPRRTAAPSELAIPLVAAGTTARVLALLTGAAITTDADLADALDVDHAALSLRLHELEALGLVGGASPDEGGARRWSPITRDSVALVQAAADAGVDLDAPLPRAPRGDGQRGEPRGRATTTAWRATSS